MRRLRPLDAPWIRNAGPTRIDATEVLVCGLLLVVLGAAVFGSHVADGGFYSDDWASIARYEHGPEPRFRNAVEANLDVTGARPILAVALVLPFAAFADDPSLHLLLGLALSLLVSACFFVLLRTLGMDRLHAGLIAALVLLFPWSDSTRLWAAASINNAAVCFYLVGAVLALRGLQAVGRRSLLLHAAAVLLYVLSVLTYEVAGIAILLSGLVYALRAPWRRVLPRWATDVLVVGATLLWAARETREVRGVAGIDARLKDIPEFLNDTWSILTSSLEPFGLPLWSLLLAAILAGVALFRRRAATPARDGLRDWLLIGAGAIVGIGAAYVVVLGSTLYPLKLGLENRGNLFAALPIVTLLYSAAMAAGVLIFGGFAGWRRASLAFAVGAALLIGAGYIDRLIDDKRLWASAADQQQEVLATIEDTLGTPPGGSTIYTFGHLGQVAPGVPVFAESWDLWGAVQIAWDDASLRGYPILTGTRFFCGEHEMFPARPLGGYVNSSYGKEERARYGKAFVVDVANRRADRIDSQPDCLSTIPRYRTKPFYPRARRAQAPGAA